MEGGGADHGLATGGLPLCPHRASNGVPQRPDGTTCFLQSLAHLLHALRL
eukprot:CAMPEP_0174864464 /NCGR_PEP_ID=MMETSP1114-20130205/58500_1 /TAXON_ID=312471 /ORGANISM="Neobodo designis, Strain CCAP 1951/1" /LENGTH=49 /DNA_ID=CAMNT_0016099569 /DNA_START=10 /DNA_END=159 /DNA_ORIENTATION=+